MKEGWKYEYLVTVCDFQGGSQPPKAEWTLQQSSDNIRMLQIRDFTQSRNVRPEYVKLTKRLKLCKSDDILIGRYGASLGKILSGLSGAYNVAIMKTIPDITKLAKPYLKYYLLSSTFQNSLLHIGGRAAQAGFNKDDLNNVIIPLPPLTEQQRIVDYLDKTFAEIDALKAKAAEEVANAKTMFDAALREEMTPKEGWEEKTLGDIASIIHGKNQKDVIDDKGQYPILGSGGNIMGYANAYLCEEGTTILGRKGTIDRPLYINYKFWNVDTAFGIKAKVNNDDRFVYYICKSINWKELNTGTTLPSLTQSVVKQQIVKVPSLYQQRAIDSRLDALRSLLTELEQKYAKIAAECDALKQAILKQVFE